MSKFFDKRGRPMELLDWAAAFEEQGRIVDRYETPDWVVSTVWTGLDRRVPTVEGLSPLIFETLVIGSVLDGEEYGYATWDEAVSGHARMLARVQRAERNLARVMEPCLHHRWNPAPSGEYPQPATACGLVHPERGTTPFSVGPERLPGVTLCEQCWGPYD